MDALPDYAELHCLSNFSFLRGASHPAELIGRAQALGYCALALTDECSVAGVVRAHVAAKQANLKFIVGAEFTLACGLKLVVLAATRRGYGQLCQLISRGRRAAPKGSYHLARTDLAECLPQPADDPDCLLIWCPGEALLDRGEACFEDGRWLAGHYAGHCGSGFPWCRGGRDAALLAAAQAAASRLGIRCVACGDVHMHEVARRPLQDALAAIRHRVTLKNAGRRLFPNGERHLRARTRARPPVSSGTACGNGRHRPALPFLARRAAIRISARDRAGRPDTHHVAAQAGGAGRPGTLAARRAAAGTRLDREGAGDHPAAGLRAVLPHGAGHREIRPRARSSARGGDQPPTPSSAIA